VLGQGSEHATGFAVAPTRVVTVAHALAGGGPVGVRVGGAVRVRAGGASRAARILRVDRRADLALLAVPGLPARAARTVSAADDEDAEVLVLRHGRAAALAATVRRAIDARVSAPGAGQPLRRPALELEAHTRAGDSGAPVVGEGGEVTGVVFARSRTRAETAYAVAAQALDRLLDGAGGGGG
jgi:S1-C subfamily serine protease